jgi:CRP-like cAMP-binding protein
MPRQAETLSPIPILSSLDAAAMAKLEKSCRWRRVAAREWVIDYQDESIDVFFVCAGAVRVLIYSKSGREVILADMAKGSYFGELAAIDGRPRSAGVLAVTDAVIAAMPGRVFMDVLRANPDVTLHVLRQLAARIRALDNRVVEYSTLNVRQRVFSELLRLSQPDPEDVRCGILSPVPTQSEIAARVSTHREAVAREMKLLEREGLLQRRRGTLMLADVPKLMERLEKQN